jgi:hypothetical protein
VVLEDLAVGRLRRAAGLPLCWTPSRARQLRHVHGNAGDERRIPDCKACLERAARIVLTQKRPGELTRLALGRPKTRQVTTQRYRSAPGADLGR